MAKINVKDTPYSAVGNGIADDTAAIQNASTAAGVNGTVIIPQGVYFVSSTITAPSSQQWIGDGENATQIIRTGDYGNTLVMGNTTPGQHAGACSVKGIRFTHSVDYVGGASTMPNKATSGAHVKLIQGQEALITDCWFDRLKYGIQLDGGANINLVRCSVFGIWDPLTPALQEGTANIFLDGSNTTPTLINIDQCYVSCVGGRSTARNYTYACTNGNSVKNDVQPIGAKWGILLTGFEDVRITNGYIGGNSNQGIFSLPAATAASLGLNISGNDFDSSGGPSSADIYFDSQSAAKYAMNVTITGNRFNGQLYGQYAIFENNSAGAVTALTNFSITGNTFNHHVGTPISLNRANNGTISGNSFYSYNTYGIGTTDTAYVNGCTLQTGVSNVLAVGNSFVSTNAHGYISGGIKANNLYNGTLV